MKIMISTLLLSILLFLPDVIKRIVPSFKLKRDWETLIAKDNKKFSFQGNIIKNRNYMILLNELDERKSLYEV